MGRRGAAILGGVLLAAGVGVLVERLIVTEREAILMEADACAEAIGRGDIAAAVGVLHPAVLTGAGDAAATRRRLEEQLRAMPLEKVNFLLQDLTIENGIGRMQLEVFIFPKEPKDGITVGRLRLTADWEKDGDRWKVRRAEFQQ
ncbi:MAG: nuclear transport factor 2 family protein [Candidatus Brocadiae bacterium]|nr:nuclear transport factor 2 family protein [Candidatus Brocadiia bacterium]